MLTSEQVQAARAMLRITQQELANWADVSLETVKRIERASGPISARTMTVDAIQKALEGQRRRIGGEWQGGCKPAVEFTNGDRPGVRLASAGRG